MGTLTNDLWLTAHDSVKGKPLIGEGPLGVGLATGLLAELVLAGFLEVRDGELFRKAGLRSDDWALGPVLAQMEKEERGWPAPAAPAWVRGRVRMGGGSSSGQWVDDVGRPQPVQVETRHRQRGHQLGKWVSYLAMRNRAEALVVRRLVHAGWARTSARHRWWGSGTRYVPWDSVVAGTPANVISTIVQRGRDLPVAELLLVGLFVAIGLHQHALATLTSDERSRLSAQLAVGLPDMLRELLRAADAAVGAAAMR
jgi:hypothetical protein